MPEPRALADISVKSLIPWLPGYLETSLLPTRNPEPGAGGRAELTDVPIETAGGLPL